MGSFVQSALVERLSLFVLSIRQAYPKSFYIRDVTAAVAEPAVAWAESAVAWAEPAAAAESAAAGAESVVA